MGERYFVIFHECDSLVTRGEHISTLVTGNPEDAYKQCDEMKELLHAQYYSLYGVSRYPDLWAESGSNEE